MKKLLMFMIFSFLVATFMTKSLYANTLEKEPSRYEILVLDKKTNKVIAKMSRSDHKVVKINNNAIKVNKKQPEETVVSVSSPVVDKAVDKKRSGHGTLIVHSGAGKYGISNTYNNGRHKIEQSDTFVLGATWCVSGTTDSVGICASGFTNESFFFGVSFDFDK